MKRHEFITLLGGAKEVMGSAPVRKMPIGPLRRKASRTL
jgi:hypothetical protein